MFNHLYELIDQLKNVDHERLEAGIYTHGRDARFILQKIRINCSELRKKIMENYYDKKADKKVVKKSK